MSEQAVREILAARIKRLLSELSMSREEFAALAGLDSKRAVDYWLSGGRKVDIEKLYDVARITGRDFAWFFLEEGKDNVTPTPYEALEVLRALVTQQPAAEPNAEQAESQELTELRAEVQDLRSQLVAAGLEPPPRRQMGQSKHRVRPRSTRADVQRKTDTG